MRHMNERARQLGMRQTQFFSANGLDDRRALDATRPVAPRRGPRSADEAFGRSRRPGSAGSRRRNGPDRVIQNRNALLWLYPATVRHEDRHHGRRRRLRRRVGGARRTPARRDRPRRPARSRSPRPRRSSNYGFEGWERETLVTAGDPHGTRRDPGGHGAGGRGRGPRRARPDRHDAEVRTAAVIVRPGRRVPAGARRARRLARRARRAPQVLGQVPLIVPAVPPAAATVGAVVAPCRRGGRGCGRRRRSGRSPLEAPASDDPPTNALLRLQRDGGGRTRPVRARGRSPPGGRARPHDHRGLCGARARVRHGAEGRRDVPRGSDARRRACPSSRISWRSAATAMRRSPSDACRSCSTSTLDLTGRDVMLVEDIVDTGPHVSLPAVGPALARRRERRALHACWTRPRAGSCPCSPGTRGSSAPTRSSSATASTSRSGIGNLARHPARWTT